MLSIAAKMTTDLRPNLARLGGYFSLQLVSFRLKKNKQHDNKSPIFAIKLKNEISLKAFQRTPHG